MGNCETKVLILEDDPLAASELKDCLAREGLHPSIACSKEHFEKIVEQHEFQLLIVDIGLPDGSGLDVIREVREQSSVGIIVVSGYTTESDVVDAIELGADDYIKKPISIKKNNNPGKPVSESGPKYSLWAFPIFPKLVEIMVRFSGS